MTTLVVGASGATGRQLVDQLLDMGQNVKLIVRSPEKLPPSWLENPQLSIIEASVLDISVSEMAKHLKGCHAVASCLGHNLNLKGIYGKPRKLVRDAVKLLTKAITANQLDKPCKLVLMNTAGNSNRDLEEPISFGQRVVLGLIRMLLPPHTDNEDAADYLRTEIGQNHRMIEWAVVRPDSLLNEEAVSEYQVYPSPTRSAIFNPAKTSRINVAHFMGKLISDPEVWNRWKGKMPVIYDQTAD